YKQLSTLISAKTQPQYALLTEDDFERIGYRAKMSPPIRSGSGLDLIQNALKDGTIDIVSSDHAPHLPEEKSKGSKDIWLAPSGVSSLGTLLPALLMLWGDGKLDLTDVARLTAASPARLFGLTSKGSLTAGADADFVLLDPS